ncbi:hypothetical protein ZIOFF_034511 [Zingiber officinale]|uniref:ER membrane protein complex subunit 2 n=1 Tax=Zingiber officinale TaxID=94328 RepID=A0A8J5GPN7_ZINOF|nr:hypothetical protein ZIOFF_034508 [Zingiber officinale]KAG6509120.1 hypothetical protein ZIOFF_034511 [Zingiber officinale]
MVGAEEAARLDRLEIQVENGGGGAWEYLCLVHKLKPRRSDKVLKHGLAILNDPKARSNLGGEEWTLYEQVAFAAFDCQQHNVAKVFSLSLPLPLHMCDCVAVLSKEFPGSLRVGRLEGMLLEAENSWAEAEKVYARLLEDNPLDQIIYKRKVAIAKAQGDLKVAVDFLNKYLEIFMSDHDAWRELAEIYVSLQMYKQAAFCYEELLLSQPTVSLYHLAYAEASSLQLWFLLTAFIEQVLYTMGGLENLLTAKKYYASATTLSGGKNTRALYGICLCSAAISQLTKGRSKEEKESSDLPSLAAEALLRDYKYRAPKKLPLLNSMLKNMKLSS